MFGIFLPTAPAVVSRCCQKCPTRTPSRLPILRLQLTYAVYGRVADGARTASSGATIRRHRLPRVAMRCKTGLSKPISLLAVACCFCALRPGWCQQWCQTVSLTTVLGPPFRAEYFVGRGDLVGDLALAIEITPASQREKRILLHLATDGPHMARWSAPGAARERP
jgi:hypothetical protein